MSLRAIWRGLLVLLLDALTLLLLAQVLPGFVLDDAAAALAAAALIGLLNALIWPALARFALPLTVLTLGLAALVLNGVLVTFAIDVVPGAEIAGVFEGVVVTIAMAAVTSIVYALLAIDENESWYRYVVRRQARRRKQAVRSEVAGRPLPRDRRPRPRRPAPRAQRRQRAEPRRLAAARLPPAAEVGDGLVLADRRLPGRAAARQQRGHAGLPLVGEGPERGDRDQPPARRGRAGAATLGRARAAARRRRQPRQHPLRRRAALDADDEHGAAPPPADRPRLRGVLRPSLRGRPHARPRPSPRSPASAARPAARFATTSAPASPAAAPTRSSAPGPPWSSATCRSPRSSATSSPGDRRSTPPSSPTTRSPTTPASSATTPSPCCATSTARSRRIATACAEAPRPYRLVVLSDHGQSQGETFRDRYGETLEDLVRASLRPREHDRRRRRRRRRALLHERRPDRDRARRHRGGAHRADRDPGEPRRRRRHARPRRAPRGRGDARGRDPGALRDGLRLPRPDQLPPRAGAGDPGAAGSPLSPPTTGAPRPPRDRVRAGSLRALGRDGHRQERDQVPRRRPGRGGGPARRPSAPTPPTTCGAPTAFPTAPT